MSISGHTFRAIINTPASEMIRASGASSFNSQCGYKERPHDSRAYAAVFAGADGEERTGNDLPVRSYINFLPSFMGISNSLPHVFFGKVFCLGAGDVYLVFGALSFEQLFYRKRCQSRRLHTSVPLEIPYRGGNTVFIISIVSPTPNLFFCSNIICPSFVTSSTMPR